MFFSGEMRIGSAMGGKRGCRGEKSRDTGLDALRLLCMLMLAAYHFINFYGRQYVNFADNGIKALIIQNFLWGGGRMICNVFFFISAWHLCEKDFKVERLFKMWASVLLYSAAAGVYSYARYGGFLFLVRHLFPLETGQVWYVSAYIAVLIVSPLLNILLQEKNLNRTRRIAAGLFVIQCVVPTFYPRAGIRFSTCGWFCLAYLIIGIIKKERIRINRRVCLLMFLSGWISCIGFYNGYDYLIKNERIMALFTELGFYRNVYFADLASLPCFFSALGLFLMFRDLNLPGGGYFGIYQRGVSGCIYRIIFRRVYRRACLGGTVRPCGSGSDL